MKTLTKKQLGFYGVAGMGPNILNLIVGAYLCDALLTVGFSQNIENWTYMNKALVVAAVWSIFVTIAKIIDGIADVPLGAWTDRLRTKWGKRRPAILIGLVPMVLSYLMMLVVPVKDESIINTIWYGLWLALFYTFYTLTMVTYYATFSEVTESSKDRVYLSNVKSTVDIIYFILGYAAIPGIIGLFNIRIIALLFLPFVLTMLIPLLMIKERSTLEADVKKYKEEHPNDTIAQIEEDPGMIDSIKYTFKNKDFLIWMGLYSVLQFGLQIYLTGFNVYYSGTMSFTGMYTMIAQVAAFAPVPFTLILFNHISKKKGFKFAYLYALGIFTIGMIFATFVRPSVFPDLNIRLIAAVIANVICSFGIGAFFSVTYTVPSQIAADEKKKTGRSHPAMYFAIQGLFGALVTSIAVGVVWVNIKANVPISDTFFLREAGGSGLLTLIVAIACLTAFVLAFWLPKSLNNIGKTDYELLEKKAEEKAEREFEE